MEGLGACRNDGVYLPRTRPLCSEATNVGLVVAWQCVAEAWRAWALAPTPAVAEDKRRRCALAQGRGWWLAFGSGTQKCLGAALARPGTMPSMLAFAQHVVRRPVAAPAATFTN